MCTWAKTLHGDAFIYESFNAFVREHPWLSAEDIRPKSIAREMFERGATFDEYVRDYGLERSEGVLLRYLAEVWRVLEQSVPAAWRTAAHMTYPVDLPDRRRVRLDYPLGWFRIRHIPLLDLRVSVTGGVHFDLVKRVLRDVQRSGQAPDEVS